MIENHSPRDKAFQEECCHCQFSFCWLFVWCLLVYFLVFVNFPTFAFSAVFYFLDMLRCFVYFDVLLV